MIRNVLFSFIKAKALGVACLATMTLLLPLHAQDRSPKVQQFEGKLAFHQDLPIGLVSGTIEHPQLIEIKSIRFETKFGNAWGVTARVGWLPVKDATWQLTIEMLDQKGHALRNSRDEPVVFTCKAAGTGETDMLYADFDLDPMQYQERRHATRFRVRLETSEEKLRTTQSPGLEPHTLEVMLVDQESRAPITDAVVVVSRAYYLQDIYRRDKTLYPTDSQGRCYIRLERNKLLVVSINAQKKGYCTINKSWSNSGSWPINSVVLARLPQRHVLEMVRAASIGGIVQDTEGNAIKAVEVRFSARLEEPSGIISIWRTIQTDTNGRWRAKGVPSEVDYINIGLRHSEYGGDHGRDRRITGEALVNARALKHVEVLKKGLTIKGKVFDEHGQPVSSATVMMASRSFNPMPAFTDKSGVFQLACSADMSDYRKPSALVIEAPGYAPAWQTIGPKPKLEPVEFHLAHGRSITCRVVDTERRPIIGARTVVEPLPENSSYGLWLENTDEQGEFQIPNVPKNDVKLSILKSGYIAVRDFVVGPSENEVLIRMNPALRVQGMVMDAQTGKPISNFEISVMFESGGRTRTSNPVAFAEGTYELSCDESQPESLQLKVSAVGYEPANSKEIRIDEGRRTIDFKLARSQSFDKTTAGRPREEVKPTGPRRITGVVRDEKGKLVSGAIVSTRPWIAEETITNAEGVFKLRLRRKSASTMSSREESVYLLVRHRERNLAAAIELDDNAETVEIKLSQGVIFSGKVIDIEGKGIPVADLFVTFWVSHFGIGGPEVTNIDAQGNYEIRAVPSGYKFSVSASAEGYGEQYVQAHTAEAVDGRIELDPLILAVANLSISGFAVDVNNKPVADARISCYGEGQPSRITQTNEDGRFTLKHVCAGRIVIRAQKGGQTRLYGHIDTEGGTTDIRILMAELDARGRPVLKRPTSLSGKPLPDMKDLKVDLSPTDTDDKMLLVCFFDMQQRPSRNCIRELAKQVQKMKEKGIIVAAVQASKVEENTLDQWIKKNDILFPVGMIEGNEEKIRFTWGVRSLPWLILTDNKHIVHAEGFALNELSEKLKQMDGE
jgi:hypothetical protein